MAANQQAKRKAILAVGGEELTCSEAGRLGGRPSLLNEELQEAICSLIEETACTVYTACLSLGIEWRTVYYWERWGREGKQPYVAFFQAVMQARARSEVNHVREFKVADRQGLRSTQYYPFILERRFAESYGNRVKIEQQLEELSDADFEAELEAARSRMAVAVGAGEGTPALPEATADDTGSG